MAFQPVANVLKHELHGSLFGIDCFTILHTNFVTPASLSDAAAAATAIRNAYVAQVLPGKSNEFHLLDVTTTDLSAAGAVQAQALGDDHGPVSVPEAPAVEAVVIQLLTGIRGRSFRGRVFDAGHPNGSFTANGALTGSAIASIGLLWENFRTALDTAVCGPLVVVSRRHAGVIRPAGVFTPVTLCKAAPVIGVQRRRRAA